MAAAGPDKQGCSTPFSDLKVAIVHYWLVTWRGGEKVLESLLKLFPNADIYTLFYDEKVCGSRLAGNRVISSSLDSGPARKHYQKLFPLYPAGIRSLKLRQRYDLILSSESGPAKGIHNPEGIPHLCYIHTPMRYCWGFTDAYLEALPTGVRGIARRQFKRLKEWDRTTIDNVDRYVANSQNVADRVRRFYDREAGVCYPPIALDLFEGDLKCAGIEDRDYYLSFGAITPYKNVDLLVETFNRLEKRLVVVGDGSEKDRLEKKAASNIEFLGSLPQAEVVDIIRNAKALLFPGEEDFGMVPLEVMSQGIPVIALGKGGALETVVENVQHPEQSSGIFFERSEPASLLEALNRFETIEGVFDPVWIRNHARRFGEDRFLEEMSGQIRALFDTVREPPVNS